MGEGRHELVQIEGFSGRVRDMICQICWRKANKKITLCLIAISLLLLLPGAMLVARAGRLNVLAVTEREAYGATSTRNALVLREDQVRVMREFFANRSLYDRWLNSLADITPDSVYLTRLQLGRQTDHVGHGSERC